MPQDTPPPADAAPGTPEDFPVLIEVIENHVQIGSHLKALGHQEELLLSKARPLQALGYIRIIGTR